jgi:hypothetical protein
MRRHLLALLALSALLVGAAACGDDGEVRTGDEPSGATGGGDAGDRDPDGARVAISIATGGGLVPFGTDFAVTPTVVLEDGTAFAAGAMIAIYPGPALAPVSTGTVDGDRLQGRLDEAEEIGLASDEPVDAGDLSRFVTDLPTTTITVRIDGEDHEIAVYGLSMGDHVGADALSAAQREVRSKVADFAQHVTDVVSAAATDRYEPDAFQVLSQPAGDGDPEVAPNRIDWPFPDPLDDEAGCRTIEGDDATTLAPMLARATQITVWTDPSDGSEHNLVVRAVLPGFPRDC